jgi:hypothetical protein
MATADAQRGKTTPHQAERQLGILLACFEKPKAAGKARRPLGVTLRSGGDSVLDVTVLKVSEENKASVHDPRRVLMGTLTPALTWGLFGLIASGWQGLVIWAVLGALCGGPYTYLAIHHASKAELAHIGKRLPANSSALLTFAETDAPRRLVTASRQHAAVVTSVAAVTDDLSARVFAGPDAPVEVSTSPAGHALPPEQTSMLSMIMLRYADPDTARKVASRIAGADPKTARSAQVELVVKTDSNGRRHVADPKLGVAATMRSDLIAWGAFGVVAGAIAGASGGGILKGGVLTGIAWGIFGLFAGGLYGFWAGRSISARRIKGLGPLLPPGSSLILAWADGPVRQEAIDELTAPRSQQLVLLFNPVARGAILKAAEPISRTR